MSGPTRSALVAACEHLADRDIVLARAYEEHGLPVWRAAPPTYETLVRIISYQQISTRAAGAIWLRVVQGLGDVSAQTVLDTSEDALRAFGLSRPKVAHMRSVARAMQTGALDLTRVCNADTEAARAELLAVKGIGPWTANLFCLYAAADLDAFPTSDLGLMESHKRLSGCEARMSAKAFNAHADIWAPYRGVAAHLLWGWLNDQRNSE